MRLHSLAPRPQWFLLKWSPNAGLSTMPSQHAPPKNTCEKKPGGGGPGRVWVRVLKSVRRVAAALARVCAMGLIGSW